MGGLIKSSIARKVAMALSGFFLVFFLLFHCTVNMTSVFSADIYNQFSHFLGTNFVVQALMQPILVFGIVFHFVMGFILEIQNRRSRDIKYESYKGSANASWVSRNMIISGAVILAFFGLHFYDFFIPELVHKYLESHPEDPTRYFPELLHKFENPVRITLYVVSFVLLAMHLWHGFASAFQSMGVNNKYTPGIKKFSKAFALVIPAAFIFIALFHHLNGH